MASDRDYRRALDDRAKEIDAGIRRDLEWLKDSIPLFKGSSVKAKYYNSEETHAIDDAYSWSLESRTKNGWKVMVGLRLIASRTAYAMSGRLETNFNSFAGNYEQVSNQSMWDLMTGDERDIIEKQVAFDDDPSLVREGLVRVLDRLQHE